MIIWGTRGLTSVLRSAEFHCPRCGTGRTGSLKQVRNFFTLYFIPVIPLNVAGKYVECASCGGTFSEEALSYDPEKERAAAHAIMLRVMVMAALADGMVDAGERDEIKRQYQELAGLPIPAQTLDDEIKLAMSSQADLNTYVRSNAGDLTPHGKALLVTLAFRTMSASGQLQAGHEQQLSKLGETLQIPKDQYLELIRQLSESAGEGPE